MKKPVNFILYTSKTFNEPRDWNFMAILGASGTSYTIFKTGYAVVKLLRDRGADPNFDEVTRRADQTRPPLSLAAESIEIAKLIVQRGSVTNNHNSNSDTRLHNPYITPESLR